MSFFEGSGGSHDRRGVGTAELGGGEIRGVRVGFTLVRFALTVVAFVALPLVATFWEGGVHPLRGLAAGLGFGGYLVLGLLDPSRTIAIPEVVLLPALLLARPVAEVFFWLTGEVAAGGAHERRDDPPG